MRVVGFLFFTALALLAQDNAKPDVVREGSDWVHRQTGAETVPLQAVRIEVHSPGGIVLRESPDNRLSYTLTQRAPAGGRTEAQAHQLLTAGVFTRRMVSPNTLFVVFQGSMPLATTTLELGVPRHFNVASLDVEFGGDISVYDFQGDVSARTGSGGIRGDRIHGSVNVGTGSGEIRFGTVDGAVDCVTLAGSITIESAGGRVNCQTGGGETIVKQAGGPVNLHADGGDISVEHAASSVDARSASGLIDVKRAEGNVIAITRGGSIQVGPARGVHAESGRGRIRVYGVSGPLSLSALAGGILAEFLAGAQIQDSTFSSQAGDITVFMPSNLAVSVMATEDSGGNPRIQSDFSELRANAFGWQRPPVVVQGAINGGGPVFHISSPVIYLRKTTK